jgi:type IV pilus assembly protein PilV
MHVLSRRRGQEGITLLESLISLMILALAVLGMLAVQVRILAETQTGVRRAQAVRLIEDLGERIRSNPGGSAELARYVADWDASPGPAPAATDCGALACQPADQASWDLAAWKRQVAETLPLGNARLFESGGESAATHRQLGVIVGWRANERERDPAWSQPFQSDFERAGVACPAGLICHLVYVHP